MSELNKENANQHFKTTSLWKVFFLSLFTCGLYNIILFYNYWKVVKNKFNKDISPFWICLFNPITNFWLFPILSRYIFSHKVKSFNPALLASFYLLLPFVKYLSLLSIFILLIIQNGINEVNRLHYPDAKHNKWSLANTIWVILIPTFIMIISYVLASFELS